MLLRQPFHGTERKLVVAFDVGTTFSGVSYAILEPGEVPEILSVTRFPGQGSTNHTKIPTIIYYDKEGNACAFGAEALQAHVINQAEENEWTKVEWFKLHLKPPKRASEDEWTEVESIDEKIPPLPANKSPVSILADFMKYLLDCTRTFIQQTHAIGDVDLWTSLEGNIDFVLSHPNGWEGVQQNQIRKAAIMAGLVSHTQDDYERIRFVTEGEASLHFCINNGLASNIIKSGKGVIIVDAGGGTVDLSAYSKSGDSFGEIATTECLFQGSVYVNRRAYVFFKEKLKDSTYGAEEDLCAITNRFDESAKLTFRNANDPSYVQFGGMRDKDLSVGIKAGKLMLKGSEVATFFEPSVRSIILAIERQKKAACTPVSAVLLVGGFAASDWLFEKLGEHLQTTGLVLYRPDNNVRKAVAHGAVSFYVDHFVSVRVARFTYGVCCSTVFQPWNSSHRSRSHQAFHDLSGDRCLPNAFSVLLSKGTRVSEDTEFRQSFTCEHFSQSGAKNTSVSVTCYSGIFPDPRWTDIEPDNFHNACTAVGNTSKMALRPHVNPTGQTYYSQQYEMILLFGLTEMKAQLRWLEDGIEQRGDTYIVYESVGESLAVA